MGFKFNVKRLCAAELRGILSVCECVCLCSRVWRVSRACDNGVKLLAKFHTLHKAPCALGT